MPGSSEPRGKMACHAVFISPRMEEECIEDQAVGTIESSRVVRISEHRLATDVHKCVPHAASSIDMHPSVHHLQVDRNPRCRSVNKVSRKMHRARAGEPSSWQHQQLKAAAEA